jgi:hypothetical protein
VDFTGAGGSGQVIGAEGGRIATFRNGDWFIDVNNNGVYDPPPGGDEHFTFGQSGDKPFTCDFESTASTHQVIGVYRSGQWFIDANGNGVYDPPADTHVASFGHSNDFPVPEKWGAPPISSCVVGVFRSGQWLLDRNGSGTWDGPEGGDLLYNFGQDGDIPVVGDWNDDRKPDIGVYRNGTWFLDLNNNGVHEPGIDAQFSFGVSTDQPVVGLWSAMF